MQNVKIRKYKQSLSKKVIVIVMLCTLLMSTSISYSQDFIINAQNMTNDDYLNLMINMIKSNYKYDISEEELYNGIYKGLFDSLDKHSMYFEPVEYKEFNVSATGEFGGIGVTIELNEEGYLKVVSPIKNTPGFRAGIVSGDVIKEVNGQSIKDWPLEKTLSIMRGAPGTELTLGIQRVGLEKLINVKIVREIIKINPVEFEIVDGNIGILTITSFNQNSSKNVLLALKEFKAKNVKGLVIDLRNNPGGSLGEVLEVSDYFVDQGKELLYVDVKGDSDQAFKSTIAPIIKDIPMVVLINESSASASEILSGVLQDYKLATIIGTNSYGKGTVQNVFDLPNGSGIKITIAEYLTPSHKEIDGVGIKPNIEIKDENLLLISKKEEISKFVPMKEVKDYKTSGEIGLNIYGAQQRLNILGYDVKADGVFNEQTISSVKKFQTAHNLKSDGVLNSLTLKELEKKVSSSVEKRDNILDEALKFIKANK